MTWVLRWLNTESPAGCAGPNLKEGSGQAPRWSGCVMVPLVVIIGQDRLITIAPSRKAPIAPGRETPRSCSDRRTMSDIIRDEGGKSTDLLHATAQREAAAQPEARATHRRQPDRNGQGRQGRGGPDPQQVAAPVDEGVNEGLRLVAF